MALILGKRDGGSIVFAKIPMRDRACHRFQVGANSLAGERRACPCLNDLLTIWYGTVHNTESTEKQSFGIYLEVCGEKILLLARDMIGSHAETVLYLSSLTIGQTICVKITHHAVNYQVYTSTMKGIFSDAA
jgi:hypothetical protein